MIRVSVLTFGFLAFAWYEMSGGADFVAGENGVELLASYTPPVESVADRTLVARADISPALNELVPPAPRVQTVLQPAAAPAAARPQPEPEKIEQVFFEDPESVAPEVEPVAQPAVAVASSIDYRAVNGSAVNLRTGPGTSYGIVTQLLRDEQVEVMDETGDGWVKLRAVDGNEVGWMSADFLTRLQ